MSMTSRVEPGAFDQLDLLLDEVGLGRDRVHHAVAAAARMRRHLEDVDDRVVDVEIDQILDAPPHGGAQFVGRHVGRFDEQQPVAAGIEHADRRRAAIRQPRQRARDRIVIALALVDATLEPRLGAGGGHLGRSHTVGRHEEADLATGTATALK